jgi:hypothetical protein
MARHRNKNDDDDALGVAHPCEPMRRGDSSGTDANGVHATRDTQRQGSRTISQPDVALATVFRAQECPSAEIYATTSV